MKVIIEYNDEGRVAMHRLIKKLENDIDALGQPIRVFSRYRICGTDGCEIMHNRAGPGEQLMEAVGAEA